MFAFAAWVRVVALSISAVGALLLPTPRAAAADELPPEDPLIVTLPDGWQRECVVTHFSRRWSFAPGPLGDPDEEFSSESGGFESEHLSIALDTPRKDFASISGSALADALFELARSSYAEKGVECELGTVAPANALGLYGFAATLTAKDGSTNELFSAELGE
ncbi:MAG: hypothetical protein JNL94_19165, partial [Planctomycetes bacterium]|nr:hypothetical protein [Planctomycetota bacterium]